MIAAPARLVAHGQGGSVDGAGFWRRVNATCAAIGAQPGRRFALVCASGIDFAVGLVALNCSGCTVVLPPAPLPGSLRACEANVDGVLTDQPDAFAEFGAVAFPGDGAAATPAAPRPLQPALGVEFYSSGSSGRPTAIPLSFASLLQAAQCVENQWGAEAGRDALVVATVPLHHLWGLLFALLWPLSTGRAFCADVCASAAAVRAAVGDWRCVIVSSPAFLSRVVDIRVLPPPAQLGLVFCSAAVLPAAVAQRYFDAWGKPLTEVYGTTESGPIATRRWSGHGVQPGWTPCRHTRLELRAEAAGDQLWTKVPCNADWTPCGDLARWNADGSFELLGRVNGVVKIADRRISLTEMCRHLGGHPLVADARMLLLPGERGQIGAVVMLNPAGIARLQQAGRRAVSAEFKAWLADVYESVVLPRKWRYVDAWPENALGKVTREFLLQQFEAQA